VGDAAEGVDSGTACGGHCRQHALLLRPVDPVGALLRADILAPAVIWVRADAVNRNDTAREVSIDVGGKVLLERSLLSL
jgi:hypothetical protein